MSFETLIASDNLAANLSQPDWVIIDCRFDLADPDSGRRFYEHSHIPGAVYAHLDKDLSGPPFTEVGRHPLPSPDALRQLFGRLGIAQDTQVVVYDDSGGAIAARLWWMLGYMGHTVVAVLDGGWQQWLKEQRPVTSGIEENPPAEFRGQPQNQWLVELDEVPSLPFLVDSREAERYSGEVEMIDPVAGHIPRAFNYPYSKNLTDNGRFLPPAKLRQQLGDLLGSRPANQATFYCGSGVTACHNLLALTHAGLGRGRLYAGSWSEWCADPARPFFTGPEPHAR